MNGAHVFEDGRLGLWIINPANLPDRLPRIKNSGLGITDLFLPISASTADMKRVRDAGLFAHIWDAVNGAAVEVYAKRVLDTIAKLSPGAADLNTEFEVDVEMEPFIRALMPLLRAVRPKYRFRLNIAPRKGAFVPTDLLQTDANLHVCEQNFFGNMEQRFSEADLLLDLIEKGVPMQKAAVCYGAACKVGGVTGGQRVRILPNLPIIGLRRGVIFQDDLLAEAGLL